MFSKNRRGRRERREEFSLRFPLRSPLRNSRQWNQPPTKIPPSNPAKGWNECSRATVSGSKTSTGDGGNGAGLPTTAPGPPEPLLPDTRALSVKPETLAITSLVKAGVDLPTIQKISGHRTLAMVLRYTHVHGQHIDQAIRAIGRGVPERRENRKPPSGSKIRTISEQTE